jgi:hypothetical protein
MREQEEIVARIDEMTDDFLGFRREALYIFLTWESASSMGIFKAESEDEWGAVEDDPIGVIKDYLPFAWEKANNFRGISASRSLMKIAEWAWLSGDEKLMEIAEWQFYAFYGKDILREVTEHVGMDPDEFDDGIRVNSEEELYG